MKKMVKVLVIFLFMLMYCYSKEEINSIYNYEEGIKTISTHIMESLEKEKISRIAVMDIADVSGNVFNLEKYISEDIEMKIFSNKKYSIVERSRLHQIIEEQKMSLSGMIDEKTTIKLGELLGVEAICCGTITEFDDLVKINIKIVNAKTGGIIEIVSEKIKKEREIIDLIEKDKKRKEINNISDSKNKTEIKNNLLLYYSFNNKDLQDSSVYGNDGVISGNLKYITGIKGKGVLFNGKDTWVKIPEKVFKNEPSEFSISVWVNIKKLNFKEKEFEYWKNRRTIFSINSGKDGENELTLYFDSYKQILWITKEENIDSGGIGSDDIKEPDTFHVVASYKKGDRISLWINGRLHSSKEVSNKPLIKGIAKALIGAYANRWETAQIFDSWIDEFRIYGSVLNEDEIKELYFDRD